VAEQERPTVIRNVSLLDGTGAAPVPGQALVVEGRRISWIGPEAQLPEGSEGHAIDGQGGTIMPGMINCHVHLTNDGSPDLFGQVERDSVTISALRGYLNLQATLETGVTSVRDCGAASGIAIELARAVDDGLIPGPRIRAAGRVITMTGGHGHFIGREADGPAAVRQATRAEIKAGAHFIKAMATGGVLTPGVVPTQTALQPDELEQIAREAHNAGRRAACHAIGNEGIKNAIRAGIDSIEHGFYLDDEALELALDHGTTLVPTLIAVNQIVNNGKSGAMPDWVVEKAESESGHHRESFAAAVRSGIRSRRGPTRALRSTRTPTCRKSLRSWWTTACGPWTRSSPRPGTPRRTWACRPTWGRSRSAGSRTSWYSTATPAATSVRRRGCGS